MKVLRNVLDSELVFNIFAIIIIIIIFLEDMS